METSNITKVSVVSFNAISSILVDFFGNFLRYFAANGALKRLNRLISWLWCPDQTDTIFLSSDA
jgi:hypothetical protein